MKHKPIRPRLWTKDFSCITVATVLSAIGGEAMNLPISLLVFDQTQSTLLSALILVCGMLPDMILPILVAPLIDKGEEKMDRGTGRPAGHRLRRHGDLDHRPRLFLWPVCGVHPGGGYHLRVLPAGL